MQTENFTGTRQFSLQVTHLLLGCKGENVFWQDHQAQHLANLQVTIDLQRFNFSISLWDLALLICANGWAYKYIISGACCKKIFFTFIFYIQWLSASLFTVMGGGYCTTEVTVSLLEGAILNESSIFLIMNNSFKQVR